MKERTKYIGKKLGSYFLVVFILFLVIIFLKLAINKEVSSIVLIRKQIALNKFFLENLVTLQKEKKQTEKYFLILKDLVPKEPNFLDLIYKLDLTAKKSQVEFNSSLKETQSSQPKVSFSVKGKTSNVLNFFSNLRKASFFFSIQKMEWQQKGNNTTVVGEAEFILPPPKTK